MNRYSADMAEIFIGFLAFLSCVYFVGEFVHWLIK
jgi:hypothetical protein